MADHPFFSLADAATAGAYCATMAGAAAVAGSGCFATLDTHTTRRTTWNAPPPHHHVPGQQARSCHNLNCVHWKKKKRWFLALTARLPGLLAYWL